MAEDSEQPGIRYGAASVRFAGRLLIVLSGFLGLLWVLVDRRSRAVDDLISRTRVCRLQQVGTPPLDSSGHPATPPVQPAGMAPAWGGKLFSVLLQVVCFGMLSVLLYPYLGSSYEMPRDPVPARFPVIAMDAGSAAESFQLIQWSALNANADWMKGRTLNLPAGTHFVQGLESPESVEFKVTVEGPAMHVLVNWHDDNYSTQAEYAVVNGQVEPKRMTLWHAMNLFLTLAIAAAGAVALGWLWRRFGGIAMDRLRVAKAP